MKSIPLWRNGAHNNYSNTLPVNINMPTTCRVLSMGTPVPTSRLPWYYPVDGVVPEGLNIVTNKRLTITLIITVY